MRKKIDESKLDISLIQHDLASIAFSLFRHWTQKVIAQYPNINLTIKDERILINDFEHSLRNAILSLLESKKFKNGSFMWGWDIGYVLGFIQGSLGRHWIHEFITKQSETYKIYAALKVTSQYLEFDSLTEIRINRLYEHFIENDTNLAEIDLEIPVKDIAFGKEIKEKDTDEKGKLKALIDAQIIKIILKMAKKNNQNDDFDLKIDDLLSNDQIGALIRVNKQIIDTL